MWADQAYHAACRGQIYFAGFPLVLFERDVDHGLEFLETRQQLGGSWLPLWFGNQHSPKEENPVYGTARVLAAYRDLDMINGERAQRGIAWLMGAQNADGGWGGAAGAPSSIEETALALEALVDTGAV